MGELCVYDNLGAIERGTARRDGAQRHGQTRLPMLLEAAEELFQLVLSVAAMYFALRLVLRRQRSRVGRTHSTGAAWR